MTDDPEAQVMGQALTADWLPFGVAILAGVLGGLGGAIAGPISIGLAFIPLLITKFIPGITVLWATFGYTLGAALLAGGIASSVWMAAGSAAIATFDDLQAAGGLWVLLSPARYVQDWINESLWGAKTLTLGPAGFPATAVTPTTVTPTSVVGWGV